MKEEEVGGGRTNEGRWREDGRVENEAERRGRRMRREQRTLSCFFFYRSE